MEDAGLRGGGVCGEFGCGGEKVDSGGAGSCLKALLGEGVSIEDDFYSGWRGCGEDFRGECGVLYVVEGEAGAVWQVSFGAGGYGIEVAGSYAGFEYEVSVRFGKALAVIHDDEGAVAASAERGGDVDVAGASVAGVPQELVQGVLDVVDTPRTAAGTLGAK